MKSQQIKNKKVIGFIFGTLNVLLGIGGVAFLLSILFFFLTLFSPKLEPFFPVLNVPVDIEQEATLQLKSGKVQNILVDDAFISFNVLERYGLAGTLNYLYFIFILGVAFYIIFLLWQIFRSIRSSLKKENPFHFKNVWRIRKIAIAVLVSALLQIIYPIILKYFWFEKIQILNQSFNLRLNFDAVIDLFWALIIFVVAEIYRIGLVMKKEQELTI